MAGYYCYRATGVNTTGIWRGEIGAGADFRPGWSRLVPVGPGWSRLVPVGPGERKHPNVTTPGLDFRVFCGGARISRFSSCRGTREGIQCGCDSMSATTNRRLRRFGNLLAEQSRPAHPHYVGRENFKRLKKLP